MTDPRLTPERIARCLEWARPYATNAAFHLDGDDAMFLSTYAAETILALIAEREAREAARDEADRIACEVFAEQGADRRELAALRAENERLRAVAEAADVAAALTPSFSAPMLALRQAIDAWKAART